jgi:hypothetical protein
MKKIVYIILAVSISLVTCKNSSKAMGSDKIEPSKSKKGKTVQNLTFDVIISFISKGEGIDNKLKDKIDGAVSSFNAKHKLKIKSNGLSWGREGEIDYNFILKNLSTSQKKEFISSMKETVGSSDMAHLTFNQQSVHKR